jgi:NAD(P)-dependent dehydrogenase (short-subunit alcohol dehydrogenase family)
MSTASVLIVGATSSLAAALYQQKVNQGCATTLISRNKPQYPIADGDTWIACDIENTCLSKVLNSKVFDQYACFYRNRSNSPEQHLIDTYKVHKNLIDYIQNNIAKHNGSLVICSSPAATQVTKNQHAEYHMAKAALEQFVRYYAVKLGPLGFRVNGVAPCLYYKQSPATLPTAIAEKFNAICDKIPLRRLARAEEISKAVDFLLSHDSSYITGQVVQVDGGFNLQLAEDLLSNF